jgi:hypothetical protein
MRNLVLVYVVVRVGGSIMAVVMVPVPVLMPTLTDMCELYTFRRAFYDTRVWVEKCAEGGTPTGSSEEG